MHDLGLSAADLVARDRSPGPPRATPPGHALQRQRRAAQGRALLVRAGPQDHRHQRLPPEHRDRRPALVHREQGAAASCPTRTTPTCSRRSSTRRTTPNPLIIVRHAHAHAPQGLEGRRRRATAAGRGQGGGAPARRPAGGVRRQPGGLERRGAMRRHRPALRRRARRRSCGSIRACPRTPSTEGHAEAGRPRARQQASGSRSAHTARCCRTCNVRSGWTRCPSTRVPPGAAPAQGAGRVRRALPDAVT